MQLISAPHNTRKRDRVTHICVGNLTIIGSDNGLSPDQRQAIIWTNGGILSIGALGTKFSEIVIEIHKFSFKKIAFENVVGKMAAILSRPQCVNTRSAAIVPEISPTIFIYILWSANRIRNHWYPQQLQQHRIQLWRQRYACISLNTVSF